jgi:tetracycline 7-halogenase / FADH2 O2-dependent halogenase
MRIEADVAIVGSGFAGSLAALALRRRGRRVVLVERGRHPRFVIGESSTPLANLLIEELADKYDLPHVRAFSKWGTWQRSRPDVAGGLKRGFTFYFHRPGEVFADDESHARQLMVGASPHDEIGDTHWYRPDFDANLVHEAESAGAIYLDETTIDRVAFDAAGATLSGLRRGAPIEIDAGFVVDASGPRGFLAHALNLAAPTLRWLPPTQAIYTHFENVARWDSFDGGQLFEGRQPPYPPDDAALHHVFPGGWIWVLRFNNGITSAGAALTSPVASWNDQFVNARPVHPWVHSTRLAFRTSKVSGQSWALLPSAAGVIDPLLSTGFPLTLLGIHRLLDVLETTAPGAEREAALREYEDVTLAELDATERLVAALYASMDDVPLFKRLTLLYFAAASYSETARRLGRAELAPGFLLHAHPVFGRDLRSCCEQALAKPRGQSRDELCALIDRAIEPFDVAGLLDRSRADWYPVRAEDLTGGASKLQAAPEDIDALLERCGYAPTAPSPASRGMDRPDSPRRTPSRPEPVA